MKEAMLYAMNHPPGITVSDPVSIKFFKKEACDKPTEQGLRCTFDLQVASANLGASMYNNIPFAVFYRDKERGGKWNMRPPFQGAAGLTAARGTPRASGSRTPCG